MISNIVSAEEDKTSFCPLDFLGQKRVFLIGDSIIKQMFTKMKCVTEYYDYSPQAIEPNLLKATAKFRINQGPYSFLIGNFMDANPMAVELFDLHPTDDDILVALFGAHSSLEKKDELRSFFKDVYYNIAKRFPGHVFWFEPLPQHFERGIYMGHPEKKCHPLSARNSKMQHWRVELYDKVVIPTSRIHKVAAYDEMAPLWDQHKRTIPDPGTTKTYADCTHYAIEAWPVALFELQKVVESVLGTLVDENTEQN